MLPAPRQRHMRTPLIVVCSVLALVFVALGVSRIVNGDPSKTTPANNYLGKIVVASEASGGAFTIKYADADPNDVSDTDRHAVDRQLLVDLLSQPDNLRGWQLCKQELVAEARATQAWADAMRMYPEDKPYAHPDNDPARYDFFSGRAQAMRVAAELAEGRQIACIDDPTVAHRWLEFTLKLPSGMRRVVIPDLYVLLYMFESAEWIVTANPPVCADGAQANWDAANARPIDKTEATDHESWSERSKYEALEQFAAMKDLRAALGYVHC